LRYEDLTEEQKNKVRKIQNKEDAEKIAKEFNKGWRTVYSWKEKLMQNEFKDEEIKDFLESQKRANIVEVSNKFDVSIAHIQGIISKLQNEGKLIDVVGEQIQRFSTMPSGTIQKIDIQPFFNKWVRFGVVSDTHLNSKYERLDVLNALYDSFEEEGIKTVLHAGNIIEGYSELNQFDVINTGVEEQVKYCIANYPKRKDIITHFITADDHEGWWVKRDHINIGKVIENAAIEDGRNDLHHLGYIEADVEINYGERPTVIKIMHPGGGSAYAKSYKPQKIIESFAGGEKPDFLIIGHYHKMISDIIRNVPYVGAGCTADQSPFLRKSPIQVNIGGFIVDLMIDEAGNVRRFRPDWFVFYNKKFYQQEIKKEYQRQWEYKW
jgi:predicted phosphodiesterase